MASKPERSGPVSGVILAAGMSTRLGRPKQLLEIGGKALVEHIADTALASVLDDVVVVVGHRADEIRAILGPRNVRYCLNRRYADGQSTSLVAALDALKPTTDAIVVLLADQPTVRRETIDRVVAARREGSASIAMASYGGTKSHPILFGSELFGEIRAIRGDQGARDVIRQHQGDVRTVDGGESEPPPDVDTEEAYDLLVVSWLPD